jgi:hypothetical protein
MKKGFLAKLKDSLKEKKVIMDLCAKYKAEFVPVSENEVVVAIPRQLSPEVEAQFRDKLSGAKKITFTEAPKIQTRINIDNIVQKTSHEGGHLHPDMEHRSMTITLNGVPEDSPVWSTLSQILRQDGFFDSWKFVRDGQETVVLASTLNDMEKNNASGKTIREEDITDLKISLANANTIDDILKAMG